LAPIFVTGLSGRIDKTSGFNSKLLGQGAFVLVVPAVGTVLWDNQMELEWCGWGQGNILLFVYSLWELRTENM